MSYTAFADYYDSLTKNVDYKKRAEYLMQLFNKLHHNTGITLDLACGTGSLTLELAKMGVDIYGIDCSAEMLSQAQQKCSEEGLNVLFLKQKMQTIDLYGTIDTCICSLDSINHLINIEDVEKTFRRVSLFMNKGGYFVFDVNTIYKHTEILKNNTFVYDTNLVFCTWQNTKEKNNTIKINLDFFEKHHNAYYRRSECFKERAYSDKELKKMLKEAGFEVVQVFDEMTFSEPKKESQRNYYIAKKL